MATTTTTIIIIITTTNAIAFYSGKFGCFLFARNISPHANFPSAHNYTTNTVGGK
jgi:hypothetical protein